MGEGLEDRAERNGGRLRETEKRGNKKNAKGGGTFLNWLPGEGIGTREAGQGVKRGAPVEGKRRTEGPNGGRKKGRGKSVRHEDRKQGGGTILVLKSGPSLAVGYTTQE